MTPTQASGRRSRILPDEIVFERFRAQAAGLRDGEGLPRFVEEEFRAFLRCGFLAGGFARFRCDDCGLDRLVPSSCKGRAACASCAGRRMAEHAAHLVNHVFPAVPVRQWVLTFPHRLRCRLIALIEESSVIERILRHLHLPTELPTPRPGRAPPLLGACTFGQNPDVAVFNSYA